MIEDGFDSDGSALKWAGGGGGGGGATYVYRVRAFFSSHFLVSDTSLKISITALLVPLRGTMWTAVVA